MILRVFIVSLIFMLTSCSAVNEYVRTTSKRPDLLIGYQTVELRDEVVPDVEIVFPSNSANISDKAIEEIGGVLNARSYFVVEATAGGYSQDSQKIARDRIKKIISVIESFGVSSNKIYVAEYIGDKKGRRGFLYSISY